MDARAGRRRILKRLASLLFCFFALFSPCLVCAQTAPAVKPQTTAEVRPDLFMPRVPPRAIAYQRISRVVAFAGMGWGLLGLWLFVRARATTRLRTLLYRLCKRPLPDTESPPAFRVFALYMVCFLALAHLWALPFGLAERAVEAQYGFLRQSPGGYLYDTFLGLLLSCVAIPFVWGGYWLYTRSPRHWWKILWGALVPLLLFQFIVQPIVIAPLFNTYTPLPDSPLKQRILELASKAGIPGTRVFVEDSSRRSAHVNAYVIGLGAGRRIVLYDTLLKELPEDQILAVVGHEMGHYVEGHIWVNFASSVLGAGFFLWLFARLLPLQTERLRQRGIVVNATDMAGLPMITLTISLFILLQSPVVNMESRYLEHRADAFALRTTHLNEAMARLMAGFAERDYSDPDPPRLLHLWFGTHPTIKERIEFALSPGER